ncbi:hypothetical protein MMC30_004144 [Trapelia coarctata]|nr:hypothetical protein [Trapelia coarctata]
MERICTEMDRNGIIYTKNLIDYTHWGDSASGSGSPSSGASPSGAGPSRTQHISKKQKLSPRAKMPNVQTIPPSTPLVVSKDSNQRSTPVTAMTFQLKIVPTRRRQGPLSYQQIRKSFLELGVVNPVIKCLSGASRSGHSPSNAAIAQRKLFARGKNSRRPSRQQRPSAPSALSSTTSVLPSGTPVLPPPTSETPIDGNPSPSTATASGASSSECEISTIKIDNIPVEPRTGMPNPAWIEQIRRDVAAAGIDIEPEILIGPAGLPTLAESIKYAIPYDPEHVGIDHLRAGRTGAVSSAAAPSQAGPSQAGPSQAGPSGAGIDSDPVNSYADSEESGGWDLDNSGAASKGTNHSGAGPSGARGSKSGSSPRKISRRGKSSRRPAREAAKALKKIRALATLTPPSAPLATPINRNTSPGVTSSPDVTVGVRESIDTKSSLTSADTRARLMGSPGRKTRKSAIHDSKHASPEAGGLAVADSSGAGPSNAGASHHGDSDAVSLYPSSESTGWNSDSSSASSWSVISSGSDKLRVTDAGSGFLAVSSPGSPGKSKSGSSPRRLSRRGKQSRRPSRVAAKAAQRSQASAAASLPVQPSTSTALATGESGNSGILRSTEGSRAIINVQFDNVHLDPVTGMPPRDYVEMMKKEGAERGWDLENISIGHKQIPLYKDADHFKKSALYLDSAGAGPSGAGSSSAGSSAAGSWSPGGSSASDTSETPSSRLSPRGKKSRRPSRIAAKDANKNRSSATPSATALSTNQPLVSALPPDQPATIPALGTIGSFGPIVLDSSGPDTLRVQFNDLKLDPVSGLPSPEFMEYMQKFTATTGCDLRNLLTAEKTPLFKNEEHCQAALFSPHNSGARISSSGAGPSNPGSSAAGLSSPSSPRTSRPSFPPRKLSPRGKQSRRPSRAEKAAETNQASAPSSEPSATSAQAGSSHLGPIDLAGNQFDSVSVRFRGVQFDAEGNPSPEFLESVRKLSEQTGWSMVAIKVGKDKKPLFKNKWHYQQLMSRPYPSSGGSSGAGPSNPGSSTAPLSIPHSSNSTPPNSPRRILPRGKKSRRPTRQDRPARQDRPKATSALPVATPAPTPTPLSTDTTPWTMSLGIEKNPKTGRPDEAAMAHIQKVIAEAGEGRLKVFGEDGADPFNVDTPALAPASLNHSPWPLAANADSLGAGSSGAGPSGASGGASASRSTSGSLRLANPAGGSPPGGRPLGRIASKQRLSGASSSKSPATQ